MNSYHTDKPPVTSVTETSPLIRRSSAPTATWLGAARSMVSGTANSVYTYFNPPPPSDASIIATIKAWHDATEATADLDEPRNEIIAQMIRAVHTQYPCHSYYIRPELMPKRVPVTMNHSVQLSHMIHFLSRYSEASDTDDEEACAQRTHPRTLKDLFNAIETNVRLREYSTMGCLGHAGNIRVGGVDCRAVSLLASQATEVAKRVAKDELMIKKSEM